MLHVMKVNDNAFERMKKGLKKREYRVNDKKKTASKDWRYNRVS